MLYEPKACQTTNKKGYEITNKKAYLVGKILLILGFILQLSPLISLLIEELLDAEFAMLEEIFANLSLIGFFVAVIGWIVIEKNSRFPYAKLTREEERALQYEESPMHWLKEQQSPPSDK